MQSTSLKPAASPVEEEVRRIRELLEGNQFGAALAAAKRWPARFRKIAMSST